jgi:hypothetical protein
MNTFADALLELAEQRRAATSASDEREKSEKAQDLLISLLHFAQTFMGKDLLAAAYGELGTDDRESVLRTIARRTLVTSMLFAKLPDDPASLERVAEEAMAVARGDAPSLFSRLPAARKRSYRVTRSKFDALTWDAYLEGLNVPASTRHGAIGAAFGHDWDTVSRWIKPARSHLGDEYVDYHLALAQMQGQRGEPYSINRSYLEARAPDPGPWQEALQRDGRRFLIIQRESLSN